MDITGHYRFVVGTPPVVFYWRLIFVLQSFQRFSGVHGLHGTQTSSIPRIIAALGFS